MDSKKHKLNTKTNILFLVIIVLISLYAYKNTFKLSLFGDDWLTFWKYNLYLRNQSAGIAQHIDHFLSLYGPQNILMGLLFNIFGYKSVFYYLTNYLFRILASISVYILVNNIIKKRLSAFVAALFLSTTFIGIESVNWVFNMTSFLGISLMSICLLFFVKSREDNNWTHFWFALFLYFFALITAPARMTGLPIILLLLDILWFIKQSSKKVLGKIIRRQLFLFAVIWFISNIGETFGPKSATIGRVINGLSPVPGYISNGNWQFMKRPFITLGSLIVPDAIFPVNESSFNKWLIIGIIFSFLALIAYAKTKNKTRLLLQISLLTTLLSFLGPQIFWIDTLYLASHRYLIITAFGMSLFWAALIERFNGGFSKYLVRIAFLVIITIQIISVRKYSRHLLETRGDHISKNIWSQLNDKLPNQNNFNSSLVLYFEGDATNGSTLHNVITFGLPPHLGLIYNIYDSKKLPVGIENYESLSNFVSTGKGLSAYNLEEKPISFENVYAFKLEGKEKIIDITEKTIQNLHEQTGKMDY